MNVKSSSVFYTEHMSMGIKMSYSGIDLITEEGKKALGSLLKSCRDGLDLSLDRMIIYIAEKTGHSLSKSAISDLENGKTDPKWNTLAIISAAGYVTHPQTGVPLTPSEMFEIACGSFGSTSSGNPPVKSGRQSTKRSSHKISDSIGCLMQPV